ncbi:MAG: mRNA surveillance protein pelota, partial [Candidatus Altiarchaeales archaeon HGW-Altiarchaeales-3]
MKILFKNPKQEQIKIEIENFDDLWYLSTILRCGDLISGKTERRIKSKEEKTRSDKGERKTITIAIRSEKVEFKENMLRVTGTIEQGPEDIIAIGSYHTFNIDPGTIISIIKDKNRWTKFELSRLRDAEKSSLNPKLVIAVIDDGNMNIGLIHEARIQHYDMSKEFGGKYYTKDREKNRAKFYSESLNFLIAISQKENTSNFIIAGAGFEKENFYNYLQQKNPEFAKKCILENIGSHGRNGIYEVLKRGTFKNLTEKLNSAHEVILIEKLLEHIGKDTGLFVYSIIDCENASNLNAVEILLVNDNLFLKERKRIEDIMNSVKAAKGYVHILNHENEAGQQLNALGGVGGILR